jgi:mRNA interferase RelE/StbE
LEAIVETPTCGKPLREELAGLRSYGMGKYRMVYRIAEDLSVEIVAIGPRRHIYEETYRKVKGQNP